MLQCMARAVCVRADREFITDVNQGLKLRKTIERVVGRSREAAGVLCVEGSSSAAREQSQ